MALLAAHQKKKSFSFFRCYWCVWRVGFISLFIQQKAWRRKNISPLHKQTDFTRIHHHEYTETSKQHWHAADGTTWKVQSPTGPEKHLQKKHLPPLQIKLFWIAKRKIYTLLSVWMVFFFCFFNIFLKLCRRQTSVLIEKQTIKFLPFCLSKSMVAVKTVRFWGNDGSELSEMF